jgi:hypothetical protein
VIRPVDDVLDPLLGVLAQALEDELGDREMVTSCLALTS